MATISHGSYLMSSVQMLQNVHVNQKIRKLLAIGKRFAVVLLPYVDNKYKNLGTILSFLDNHRLDPASSRCPTTLCIFLRCLGSGKEFFFDRILIWLLFSYRTACYVQDFLKPN